MIALLRAIDPTAMNVRRAAVALAAMSLACSALALERVCPSTRVMIAAERDAEAALACEALVTTLGWMGSQGLDVDLALAVELVDRIDDAGQCGLLGQSDIWAARIKILDLYTAQTTCGNSPPFGVPMTEPIWQSFVAHEVAHAVAHHNSRRPRLTRTGQEYIASVVQLESMEAGLRASIIRGYDTNGFERDTEITELFYAMNPELFAVKAWLHYRRPENGPVVFLRILGHVEPPR
jgi:hypothetical protein